MDRVVTTPKKNRFRGQSTDRQEPRLPDVSVLDEDFDEVPQADAEFSHWRWPKRAE